MRDRFFIGRALHGLLSSQVQIFYGFLRIATATVVMREVAVVLLQAIAIELFDRISDLLVLRFALLLQYRVIGDILRQGVLEDILDLGKRGLFVEKLLVLERGEESIEFGF